MIRRLVPLVFCFALVAAACGDSNEVGNNDNFQFDDAQAEALGGSSTTSTTEAVATIPDQTTTTVAGQTTTTAAQTTTTLAPEQQEVSVEVEIRDDGQDGKVAFTPNEVVVPVNGKVRFLNIGTVARTITDNGGAFQSPPIEPGGVWIWTPTAPGRYNYTDDTRPYAGGAVVVQ